MLPFVIGGGILIAIAFLLDDYSIDPSNFGMNTPAAAFFKTAGGVAFNFMLPILAGFIAMSIADRPGLMVGFVGGSVASAGTTCYSNFRWFPWRIICRFLSGLSCISFRKDYRENARFHGWSSSDVNLPGSWIIIDQCDHVRDQSILLLVKSVAC